MKKRKKVFVPDDGREKTKIGVFYVYLDPTRKGGWLVRVFAPATGIVGREPIYSVGYEDLTAAREAFGIMAERAPKATALIAMGHTAKALKLIKTGVEHE